MVIEEKLRKKVLLVFLLLLALWLLVDDESSSQNGRNIYRTRHHLAVWTALKRHPPCSRIFRALLELNLMLWGLAFSLWLWKGTIGEKMTGYLLFQPADHDEAKDRGVYFTESALGKYRRLEQHQEHYGYEEEDITNIENEPNDEDLTPTEDEGNNMYSDEQDDAQRHTSGHEMTCEIEQGNDVNESIIDDEFANTSIPTGFEVVRPPSPIKITYSALDFLILILIALFMFTVSSAEGGRYVDGMESIHTFRLVAIVAAPIFPLLLFLAFSLALVVPWKGKRRSQWKILSYTIGAPLYHVTFRDGFIGDILTSSVRPLQDIAFTTFYFFSGLQGWWQQSYGLDAADLPLESSWVLHTMILPMCMMSPLWYRFCQNLRQTYEYKSRWPYLGNALKYLIAAEVGIFGVFMQNRSGLWLMGFVAATLYQIWWDVFMDWELLHVAKWKAVDLKLFERVIRMSAPSSLQLRKTRIYSVSWLYWGVFGINIVLRFCWTLSLLPPYYLNRAGVLSENFDGDLTTALNPIIASAEIIRRTMWGWLRVEWEAIKVARKEPRLKGIWTDHGEDEKASSDLNSDSSIEFRVMTMKDASSKDTSRIETLPSISLRKGLWTPRKMYEMSEIQILGELCIYATVFTGIGLLAAAHRDTF